jgi:hypothetical protein
MKSAGFEELQSTPAPGSGPAGVLIEITQVSGTFARS